LPTERFLEEGAACWRNSSGQEAFSQRVLDDGVSSAVSKKVLLQADPVNKASLLASLAPGSGSWLKALPSRSLGLLLRNTELHSAVGLHLGTALVQAHQCVCGSRG